jgi:hypothetical protein
VTQATTVTSTLGRLGGCAAYHGEGRTGLSTYWIELLASSIGDRVPDTGDETAILHGNRQGTARSRWD